MNEEGRAGATLYRITHRTEYRYDAEVTASYSEARLLPRTLPTQRCLETELHIEPTPSDHTEHLDFYGNRVSYFSVDEPHTALRVDAVSVVEVTAPAGRSSGDPDVVGPVWHEVIDLLTRDDADPDGMIRSLALDSPLVRTSAALRRYADPSFPSGTPVATGALDLCRRIFDEFTYKPGSTTVSTPLEQVMAERQGVCQDFAHLAVGCLRSLGLPARYVSGYLETDPPPGAPKLEGSDASHAWADVFVPGHGWMAIDPTNGTRPDQRWIITAWGRDYADVTPLKGVVYSSGRNQKLKVAVDVVRLTDSLVDQPA